MEPTPQLGSEEKAMEGSHGPGHTQLSRWKPLELDAHGLWLSSPLVCNINFESGATQEADPGRGAWKNKPPSDF